jgi:hypothetical protein
MIIKSITSTSVAALMLLLPTYVSAQRATRPNAPVAPQATSDPAVQRLVDDYIGLYRKDTLERWKALFLPAFTASYTNTDGTVTTRNLNEFYESQRNGFAAGEMSETLQNVRIQRVGRLAHVSADFTFTSRGSARPGRLMLLMIEDKGQFKIAALAFTYHVS